MFVTQAVSLRRGATLKLHRRLSRRPDCKLTACVTLGHSRQRCRERAKNIAPVARAQQFFAGPFGVWHQAEYVASGAADARNVVARAVRICGLGYLTLFVAVTKNDALVALQLG